MRDLKPVEPLILTVRNQKVILDTDLAEAYGVETRVLNQAVEMSKVERASRSFEQAGTLDLP